MRYACILLAFATLALKAEVVGPNTPVIINPDSPEAVTVRMEDSFQFAANDRRDPFTFTKVIPKAAAPGVMKDDLSSENMPLRMDAAQVAAKRAEMLNLYNNAESELMNTRYMEAMTLCDRSMDVIKDIRIQDYRELQTVRDMVMRLRKASERGHRRDEAERDFNIINLHLTGVVIGPHMPKAIVNGRIVGMGDTIMAGDTECPLFSISRDQITVIYRNYRMPVEVERK